MIVGWRRIREIATPHWRDFACALDDPAAAQRAQLATIIAANETSRFGREHDFGAIGDPDAFRRNVPIRGYGGFAADIEATADGVTGILTGEPIVLFEQTGGSSSASKMIPYTAASLLAFQRALYPWLADCLRGMPSIAQGRAYWALSPAVRRARHTKAGIPVGAESDALYFGTGASAFQELSVAGMDVACAEDFNGWRYLTALSLLRAEDLALVSIWSPSFLFPILDTIELRAGELLADIARSPEGGRERARRLEPLLGAGPLATDAIWPRLDTISCWTDASAKPLADDLAQRFPHCRIQGKGLLATEGAVTIPLSNFPYPVLALNSGFYEFIDADGQALLCDQLVKEAEYRVVMTNHGGLYRYDTGDRVRMRGWARPGAPMLEFVGRAGVVSDICGEKLTGDFVESCLADIPGFRMLIPSHGPTPQYLLVVDENSDAAKNRSGVAERIDRDLAVNPQYLYARNLGQLGPIAVLPTRRPMDSYMRMAMARGQRFGDIKPAALSPDQSLLDGFDLNRTEGFAA